MVTWTFSSFPKDLNCSGEVGSGIITKRKSGLVSPLCSCFQCTEAFSKSLELGGKSNEKRETGVDSQLCKAILVSKRSLENILIKNFHLGLMLLYVGTLMKLKITLVKLTSLPNISEAIKKRIWSEKIDNLMSECYQCELMEKNSQILEKEDFTLLYWWQCCNILSYRGTFAADKKILISC